MTETRAHPFTWVITGATRGFGRAITERALANGDAVVATVRRPEAMAELSAAYPDRLEVIEFDATNVAAAGTVADRARQRFARIDVLVNNAGRGIVGAAEEVTDADLRDAMDLHLMGPAALVRAVLPTMCAQGSGTIVQMSSQGGRLSFPGVGAYSAGKFALEGWSEALAGEVRPFGVRVLIVEPSRFRTSFNEPDVLTLTTESPTYADVLGAVRADMAGADGRQEGDPMRAAAVIVDLAHAEEVPLRLPLGAEAVRRIGDSYRANLTALDRWADVARGTDFPDVAASVRPV